MVIAASLLATLIAVWQPTFIEQLELKTLDARFHLRGVRQPDPRIVIVAVDNPSVDKVGRWPWPRDTIGAIITRLLDEYHARVVALDMVFSEPQVNPVQASIQRLARHRGTDRKVLRWLRRHAALGDIDRDFESILRRHRERICLGYFFYLNPRATGRDSAREASPLLQPSAIPARDDGQGGGAVPRMRDVTMNLPRFAKAADIAGFFNFFPDPDGLVRRVPLVAELDGFYYPSLDLQTARMATGWPPLMLQLDHGGVAAVTLNGRDIATDIHGQMLLNHYGPGYTFRHVPALDVLQGKADPALFKNAIVLFGVTATAVYDLRPSPFDATFPGVEAHATAISNILHREELQRPAWLQVLEILLVLTLGLACGRLVLGRGALVQGAALIGAPLFILAAAHAAFSAYGIWLKETYLILAVVLSSLPVTLVEYVVESRKRAFIHDAFSHYLAPEVVDELARHPEQLRLGGEEKELTAMFSDIAGFTSFSEAMSAEELVAFLNQYLSAMSDIILEHGGTVDKYEGDAIIAFFGAPLPMADHALRAVRVALAQQAMLKTMRARWAEQGYPEVRTRIGINTGPMVVGNVGTESHFNYTIMGDNVNLASRLEGVNKAYGTDVLVSGATAAQVRDAIETRLVDRVLVVGKRVPVDLHEPLGEKGAVDAALLAWMRDYEAACEAMRARQFGDARRAFESLLQARPDDGPAQTMLKRCRRYEKSPPPEDWDGAHRLSSK